MTQKTIVKGLKGTDFENQTRLLLFLWNLGGVNFAVKQSELNKVLTRTNERNQDYQKIYQQLAEINAITLEKQGRNQTILLTEIGLEKLRKGLTNPEFIFTGQQVGSRVANALLKWIRSANLQPRNQVKTTQSEVAKIETYQEFEKVILDIYNRLNRDYNMDDLVPIYQVRRELGECLSRSQFRDWLFEMQGNDLIQLIGGEMSDISQDKIEDSVQNFMGEIRYYIQLL